VKSARAAAHVFTYVNTVDRSLRT